MLGETTLKDSRHGTSTKLQRLLELQGVTQECFNTIEDRKEYLALKAEIETALYIQNWLIYHKIQCDDSICLCNSSTPFDALAELYAESAKSDIAEALDLSNDKIAEVKRQLVKSGN